MKSKVLCNLIHLIFAAAVLSCVTTRGAVQVMTNYPYAATLGTNDSLLGFQGGHNSGVSWQTKLFSLNLLSQLVGANLGGYTNAIANAYTTNTTAVVDTHVGKVVAQNLLIPSAYPGLAAYWSAYSLNLDDGQLVTNWPDSSGNGNALLGKGTYARSVVNGAPGVWLGGSGCLLSNANFFTAYPTANTNCTIIMVLRTLDTWQGNNATALAAGYPWSVRNSIWFNLASDSTPGALINMGTNRYTALIGKQLNAPATILTVRYDNTNFDVWVNGRIGSLGLTGGWGSWAAQAPGGLGLVGGLYLGNSFDLAAQPFNGYLSELYIFTNALSYSQIATAHKTLCKQYGRTGNNLLFNGDSLTVGDGTTNGATLKEFAGQYLTGWQIDQYAQNGQTSTQGLTNQPYFLYTARPESPYNIWFYWYGANDFNTNVYGLNGLLNCETNLLLSVASAHSNNWQFIAATVISTVNDSNQLRLAYNAFIRTNAGLFDAVADFGTNVSMGTNNAFQNPALYNAAFPGHPTPYGMMLISNIEISAIQSVIYGSVPSGTGGSTNYYYTTNITQNVTNNVVNNIYGAFTNTGYFVGTNTDSTYSISNNITPNPGNGNVGMTVKSNAWTVTVNGRAILQASNNAPGWGRVYVGGQGSMPSPNNTSVSMAISGSSPLEFDGSDPTLTFYDGTSVAYFGMATTPGHVFAASHPGDLGTASNVGLLNNFSVYGTAYISTASVTNLAVKSLVLPTIAVTNGGTWYSITNPLPVRATQCVQLNIINNGKFVLEQTGIATNLPAQLYPNATTPIMCFPIAAYGTNIILDVSTGSSSVTIATNYLVY